MLKGAHHTPAVRGSDSALLLHEQRKVALSVRTKKQKFLRPLRDMQLLHAVASERNMRIMLQHALLSPA
jgi:hypothetical protein